jgi:hypothetical protein
LGSFGDPLDYLEDVDMIPHKDTTLWQFRASRWLDICRECGNAMLVVIPPEHTGIYVGYGARWVGKPDNDP